jgi:uncharacterized protein (TIGR00369 family)
MQNKIHDTNEISLLERYNASNNFGKLLNIDFKIISDGVVEYYLKIEQKHLATPQAAHGGVVAALVDSALGVAGLSAVYKERKAVSTVEFKLNYLSPALLNDELIAKAKVEQMGKRIMIISCDVLCLNRGNKVVAKALGTFNAYEASKAGY